MLDALDTSARGYLVQRAVNGDTSAFDEIFTAYYTAVYDFAVWLSHDPPYAQDLAQEVFIQAHRKLHHLREPWNIKSWLFRIAQNLLIDHKRREKPVAELDADEGLANSIAAPKSTIPEEAIASNELSNPVRVAIQRLSTSHREMLVLREVHGMSYDEIADTTNNSLDYVKVNLHRARKHFKEYFSYQLLVEDPKPVCDELNEMLLEAHLDGELKGTQVRIIRNHIKTCDMCEQRKRELVALGGVFAAVPMMQPPGMTWAELADRAGDRLEGRDDTDVDTDKRWPDQSPDEPPAEEFPAQSASTPVEMPAAKSSSKPGVKIPRIAAVIGGIVLLALFGGVVLAFSPFDAEDGEQIEPIEGEDQPTPEEVGTQLMEAPPTDPGLAQPPDPADGDSEEPSADEGEPPSSTEGEEGTPDTSSGPNVVNITATFTSTPTEEVTPSSDPNVTVEFIPVYDCQWIEGSGFQWYEAERTYIDGTPVADEITGGPVSGGWQPGCPPEPPPPGGGTTGGTTGGVDDDDGPGGPGSSCSSNSDCAFPAKCISGVCVEPAG